MVAIVVGTKVFYTLGLAERSILTSDMIGYKVDDDPKTSLASPAHQCLKLSHTIIHILGKVGIDIIIIGDGIGRTCITLDNSRVIGRYAVGGVVGLGGMAYHTCKPNM